MESLWRKTTAIESRAPLIGDAFPDVAVIGGGMAGMLTAWFLSQRGLKTIVLEAGRIASGQTQNTTAKITAQHGLIYDKLGPEQAALYAEANLKAIAEYERLIHEQQIDCEFVHSPAFLFALGDAAALKKEADAAKQAGIKATFTTQTTLPFPIAGAVRFGGQAQFHPLKFLEAIARQVTVYEQTKVTHVQGNKVYTETGIVTAKEIVFASHFPFVNLPGLYFARMHQERSSVIALEGAAPLDGMYLGVDGEALSLRCSGELVLLGGMYLGVDGEALSLRCSGELVLLGGSDHRTGENSAGGSYEALLEKAQMFWPGCREVARWSAQDCMTADGIPYIGRFAASTPHWYVATGFGKWGMTGSMVSALLLTQLILGEAAPWAPVFSPSRRITGKAAKGIAGNGMQAVKGLGRSVFSQPRITAEALPRGEGGIVRLEGKKMGLYKDLDGTCFFVEPRCPHMGCQLEWNPDELSWDCPCHGSRFDYRGHVLTEPAQTDLAAEERPASAQGEPE